MRDRTSIVIKPLDTLYQLVAESFMNIVTQSVYDRNVSYVTLSGGNTPQKFFQLLSQSPFRSSIPWEKIHFFWADERCVPPEHPESNFGMANKYLFDNLPVRSDNIHRIKGELNPYTASEAYIKELRDASSGKKTWPFMDYTLLGIGEDGHTASLFPGFEGADVYSKPVSVVTATYQNRHSTRITLTPMVLNSSRNVAFLVTGESKAKIISEIMSDHYDKNKYPVYWIQPIDGTVKWYLDTSAAELVK